MRCSLAVLLCLALAGCAPSSGGAGAHIACDPEAPASPTISCVEELSLGEGAGFGALEFPDLIYGEPKGGGSGKGSMDVLSLGASGSITVGFDGGVIADGPGPDFIVFENVFNIGGDPANPYKELAAVSVSEDGETWVDFTCESEELPFEGCAGWHPTLAGSEPGIDAFDPEQAGGDAFDLADIGVASARFVRITDLSLAGAGGSAGFDLDAVTIVNSGR